ncbi:hypothetical protein TVAG_391830 [Trichomonas vaginalis G3]|uniref:Tubby C-terminal domain-containing protein n=1 Tax=Trichomonas vaginalis (strain ATCC PRA-98 / G3) TaxID=412133 RepID=A2DFU6_TRIV3|nr:phosphatidylinositol binding [Trichomonas vaginalis G3]EAY20799.1 hypothetical protein TVAG_391830 [Trichomonas vaginalis G3]KAI5529413.1 phosphatidylinositol binding [Trichomonas vaginalis G3]|eukprot:XP_001581785.1 hypothetical protein [Trichomonas vaginalis G3]
MTDDNIETFLEKYQHKFKDPSSMYYQEFNIDAFTSYKPDYIPLFLQTNKNPAKLQKIEVQQPPTSMPNKDYPVRGRRKLLNEREEIISVDIPTIEIKNPMDLINSPIKQQENDYITPSTPVKSSKFQIAPPPMPPPPMKGQHNIKRKSSLSDNSNHEDFNASPPQFIISEPSKPLPNQISPSQLQIKITEPQNTPEKVIQPSAPPIRITEPSAPPPRIIEPKNNTNFVESPKSKNDSDQNSTPTKPWSPERDTITPLNNTGSKNANISVEIKDLEDDEADFASNIDENNKKYIVDSTNIHSPVPKGSTAYFTISLTEESKKGPKYSYIDETTDQFIMNAIIETSISGISIKYYLNNDSSQQTIAKTESNFSRLSFYTVSENKEITAIEFKSIIKQNSPYRLFNAFVPVHDLDYDSNHGSTLTKPDSRAKQFIPQPPTMKDGIPYLNFGKRVKTQSVKNFIMMEKDSPHSQVLFFGKIHKTSFAGEIRYPISPLAAFSLCLPHL